MHMSLGKASPRVVTLEVRKAESSRGSAELCSVLCRGPSIRGAEVTNHWHGSALSVGSAAQVL